MKFEYILKYLLGFFLIMVGANKFIPFMPGMNLSPEAAAFMASMMDAGYLLPIVGGIEVLCGAMLLKKNTTPLGLILLAPISVNIILFHLFLDPGTIMMALFVGIANVFLLYKNFDFYTPMIFSITNGKKITRQKLQDSNLSYN